jgi:hypothetical protein
MPQVVQTVPRWLVGNKPSSLGVVHRRAQAQKVLTHVRATGMVLQAGSTNQEKGRNVWTAFVAGGHAEKLTQVTGNVAF